MSGGKILKFLVLWFALSALTFFLISVGLSGMGRMGAAGRRKVARVDIIGPILSAGETIEEIKKHDEDDGVGAILIRIDSPGGGVAPSQEIYRELFKIREKKKKPVVVSVGNLGASGGYYIAAAANRIYANSGSLVGSIGVILELTKIGELLRKIGVGSEVVKSGPYKDIGSPFRQTTDEERLLLQGVIDDTHRQFVEAVAKGRGLPIDKVAALADGRVFTGAQARELGLVDELGGLEDALAAAGRMAGIQGPPQVIKPRRRLGWRYLLDNASTLIFRGIPAGDFLGPMYLWRP